MCQLSSPELGSFLSFYDSRYRFFLSERTEAKPVDSPETLQTFSETVSPTNRKAFMEDIIFQYNNTSIFFMGMSFLLAQESRYYMICIQKSEDVLQIALLVRALWPCGHRLARVCGRCLDQQHRNCWEVILRGKSWEVIGSHTETREVFCVLCSLGCGRISITICLQMFGQEA